MHMNHVMHEDVCSVNCTFDQFPVFLHPYMLKWHSFPASGPLKLSLTIVLGSQSDMTAVTVSLFS